MPNENQVLVKKRVIAVANVEITRKTSLAGEYALTVLHHVANDAKLVKVSASALGADLLLESDLDVVDALTVPDRSKDDISKPQDHQVLDHLLAEIVIDAVNLLRDISCHV